MIKVTKKFQKVGLYTVVLCVLIYVGHSIALVYSSEYNAHLDLASKLLSEYFESVSISNSTVGTVSVGELLTFKEKGPKSRLSKKEIVDWNMDLLNEYLNLSVLEPRVDNLVRSPSKGELYERANATLVCLVRNKELESIKSTIKQIEAKFNEKFNYPYVFLNDGLFTDHFVNSIKKLLPNREVYFELIDPQVWNKPDFIDQDKEDLGIEFLTDEKISYADQSSYHNMCRYYSGNFYNHPRLQQFKWYWRFEPGTNYFCDIDYDLFKFMEDNNKTYGFTIALYDAHQSVKSLWTTTLRFLKENPNYLNPNGAFKFLTENLMNPEKTSFTQGYSTCHFWSNFEIGNMDFFRLDLYNNWFKFLDEAGGFYYERWGDAPVHSIGLSLFEDKDNIHWFRDIGYEHSPYVTCPNSDKCYKRKKGDRKDRRKAQCEVGRFTFPHLYDQNCIANWIRYEMNDEAKDMYRLE